MMLRLLGAAVAAIVVSWSGLAEANIGPFNIASFDAIGTDPNIAWTRDDVKPGYEEWTGGSFTSLPGANVNFRFLPNDPVLHSNKYLAGMEDLIALGDLPALMTVSSTPTVLGTFPGSNGFTSWVTISFTYAGDAPLVANGETYNTGALLFRMQRIWFDQGSGSLGYMQSDVFDFYDWPGVHTKADIDVVGAGPVIDVGGFPTYANFQGQFASGSFAAAIPEPQTWAMLIVGFGGVGTVIRNRRRSQQTAGLAA